jgi:hypothetical protein
MKSSSGHAMRRSGFLLERIPFILSGLEAAAVLAVVRPFVSRTAGVPKGISRFAAALRHGHGGTMTIGEGACAFIRNTCWCRMKKQTALSPKPVPVLPASGAAGANAIFLQ